MFGLLAFVAQEAPAQIPVLPAGAQTHWVVDQAEEVVCYFAFDPTTLKHRLPPTLRFITLEELASGGVHWAKDHLAKHPSQGQWGVSFLEIVRMQTFSIDGQTPMWPENGAAGLWCARVTQADSARDLGPGRPLLILDFWMPDSMYVVRMRQKGHYATYGNVKLFKDNQGKWHGSISAEGLSAVTEFRPTGPVRGGTGSAGMQVLIPPASSTVTDIVRVAFAGHREQDCDEDSSWTVRGTHPLASCVILGPSTFEFGYNLIGGAYRQ